MLSLTGPLSNSASLPPSTASFIVIVSHLGADSNTDGYKGLGEDSWGGGSGFEVSQSLMLRACGVGVGGGQVEMQHAWEHRALIDCEKDVEREGEQKEHRALINGEETGRRRGKEGSEWR